MKKYIKKERRNAWDIVKPHSINFTKVKSIGGKAWKATMAGVKAKKTWDKKVERSEE